MTTQTYVHGCIWWRAIFFFNYYRREKEKVPLGEVQQIQNTASQEVLEGILKRRKTGSFIRQ